MGRVQGVVDFAYLKEYGVGEKGLASFAMYKTLLLQWNEKMNLTAITGARDIEIKHFVDSLLLEKSSLWVESFVGAATKVVASVKVVDVGSGAGFPGLPLRIVHDNLCLMMLESSAKKVSFLSEVTTALALGNAQALHMRAEEAGRDPGHRAKYDWALSRGVASTAVLLEYCLPLLKVGGFAALYKGPTGREEVQAGAQAAQILGGKLEDIVEATLPEGQGKRQILIYRKHVATPGKYPRKPGTPAKQPL